MIIGIDYSRATVEQKTGTETYAKQLVDAMLALPSSHTFRLYTKKPVTFAHPQVQTRIIPYPFLWTQLGLAGECFLHPPDILFIPAHTLPVLRRPKIKTVVTIHDLGAEYLPGYHQFPQKHYLTKSTEYAVSHATHLIAVSEATKKDLITKMHCDANKISVVYEGYRKDYFKHLGKSMVENDLKKLKVTPPFLLFVGTIQPRKNVMRLIQAFSKLASDYPSLSLCLVGKKGWLSDDVYALPTQLGLSDRVKFLGHVKEEDLVALYNGAELLVFPSLFEGFGLPVVEAFACGLPVVTSSTSSLPEVGGDACVYVEPTSIEEIEGAIRRVLSNTMLRDELIRKGLKQAGTFSWEKAAKETLTVLERVYENTM